MGKMRQFRRAIRGCVNQPLLFDARSGFGAVAGALLERVADPRNPANRVHDAEIQDVFDTGPRAYEEDGPQPKRVTISGAGPIIIPNGTGKAVAIVPCRGVALYDLEFQPYCFSTLLLAQTMNALANDPEIGTIILDIDSPGGMVTGTAEAGDAIFAARRRKKVVALVNPLAASAAYWIASQAGEIVAIKSGDIGSIGVYMVHTDCSMFNEQRGMKVTYIYAGEFKVEGNPDEPLADSARAYYQSEVDAIYQDFLKAVARGRSATVQDVFDNFGKGRCMSAKAAKAVGMIDDFMTINEAFSHWGVPPMQRTNGRRGEDGAPDPAAETIELTIEGAARDDDAHGTVADEPSAAPAPGRRLVSSEGCESITIRCDRGSDGVFSYYAEHAWPGRTAIGSHLADHQIDGQQANILAVEGDVAKLTFVNARAQYAIIGQTEHGDLICALIVGEFTEPPSPPALEIDPDGPAAVAARETTAREAAAAARRRRLALVAA